VKKFLQTLQAPGNRFYRRCRSGALAFLLLLPAARALEFSDAERGHWQSALRALNAAESDLGFLKDVGEPRSALNWIRAALHEPSAMMRAADGLWECAETNDAARWWGTFAGLLELGETPAAPEVADSPADMWEGLDASLASALSRFMLSARAADGLLARAYAGLSPEEMAALAAQTLGGVFNVEDDASARRALEEARIPAAAIDAELADGRRLDATPGAERFLAAAAKLDLAALVEAGHIFHQAVADLALAARAITNWPDGNVVLVTDLGKVRITGGQDATFTDDALLILSPRGRTTYAGAAGSASALRGQRLAAIIDLEGDDVYRGDALLGPGAALFGVAVVRDDAGSDAWRAAYAGAGAGLWGVGWVDDLAGDDTHVARALGQGAAVAGIGMLRDGAGNDRYEVGWQGQGFAGWRGVGVLVDAAGHDRYFAGGREPDHERNPDRFLSLAQGFSIGARPFAGGGVGALIDLAGNDTYEADVYGQGASYYYSAGFLLDGGGHDRYFTHHYGQGCGIHLSLGFLFDADGNDHYTGGTLAQGAAHDFGVGGLLDRGGDDTYVATRHSQGHGMNNALGWLLDAEGTDVYDGREPDTTQGVGNTGGTRESGSLGLLLDLGGHDRYSGGGENDRRVLRPLYGVVYDVDSLPEVEPAP